MRIEIRHSSLIKDEEDVIGRVAKVKVVKNKVATPLKDDPCDEDFSIEIED